MFPHNSITLPFLWVSYTGGVHEKTNILHVESSSFLVKSRRDEKQEENNCVGVYDCATILDQLTSTAR